MLGETEGRLWRHHELISMADDDFSLGLAVYPVRQHSTKSPFRALFAIIASPHYGEDEVTDFLFDFGDGTPPEQGKLQNGFAQVEHIYTYEKAGKYYGTTFYPFCTIRNNKYSKSTGRAAFYVEIELPPPE